MGVVASKEKLAAAGVLVGAASLLLWWQQRATQREKVAQQRDETEERDEAYDIRPLCGPPSMLSERCAPPSILYEEEASQEQIKAFREAQKEQALGIRADCQYARPLRWTATGVWMTIDDSTTSSLEINLDPEQLDPGLNRTVQPDQWSISVCQLNHFIKMARRDTVTWERLAQSTAFNKKPGIVNLYQLCDEFVKPFTRSTGCGVSLLYNNDAPLQAQVMISHCWAEDILEVQEAIWDLAFENPMGPRLQVWFCIFANYQCGDEPGDIGPSISEQLLQDPFGCVIRSSQLWFMCLCITSQQDPYDRLWCVYELDVALDMQEQLLRMGDWRGEKFVQVEFSHTASILYAQRIRDWVDQQATDEGVDLETWAARQVKGPEYAYYIAMQDCEKAKCGRQEDTDMIRSKIMQRKGGWLELNDRMARFRKPPKPLL